LGQKQLGWFERETSRPKKFEMRPDWGAIRIAVSILYSTGDPNSTLELAVPLLPNIPDARQSIPHPANLLKVNLLSAISAAIGKLTVIALNSQGEKPESIKPNATTCGALVTESF
jgi:hypothetical protein